MIGNFIADFVKGRGTAGQFNPGVVMGINLHRAIDEFTDHHPVVQLSKGRLRPKYRHYSGVIVDIFYDHFLARYWDEFHAELLPDYAGTVYDMLSARQVELPEGTRWMLPYMIKGDWLTSYARLEGIQKALTGMSRRATFSSRMEESTNELRDHYTAFESEFRDFFPQLRDYSANFLNKYSA